MANKRIKDISTASTSFASDDFVITDSATSGTRKMTKGDLVSQVTVDVNSIAQDAESSGTKLQGPSMHFNGSAYVTIASDAKLSFEGSGNDLPFTFACWTKLPASAASGTVFFSKWVSASEYSFQTTSAGNLILYLSDGSNTPFVKASTALPTEQWVHVCGTYAGTTGGAFSSAANGLTLYVNGEAVTATQTNKPAYTGMTAGSDALQISRLATTNYEQTIRDTRIYNKALSASEVKTLCLSGSLPESFAESTGGAEIYSGDSSTFAGGLGNWTEEGSTSLTVAASGGEMVITNTAGASGGTKGARNLTDNVTEGKKLRLTFSARCSSGTATGMTVKMFNGSQATSATKVQGSGTASTGSAAIYSFTPTGSNETHIIEFVLAGSATDKLFYSVYAAGTGEVYNFDNITLTQLGPVLDARAEQFDTSTAKLYDLSGNDFVGTNNGATLLGREVPVYETGTWNGVYSPATGSFATMTMDTSLVYTRIGNLVTVTGFLQTDNVDITGGSGQLQITGLPFAASVVSTCQIGFAADWGSSFPLSSYISGSSIRFLTRTSTTASTGNFDVGGMATGALANRNTIYISATYQIS